MNFLATRWDIALMAARAHASASGRRCRVRRSGPFWIATEADL